MIARRIFIIVFIITFFAGHVRAQIFAPAADHSFNALYSTSGNIDKVFVFNCPTYQSGITASIKAVSVDSLNDWSFQWFVFDPLTMHYVVIPGTGAGFSSTIDTITVPSGYQVEMFKGTERDTFRIWILINDLDLKIIHKDEADTLEFGYYSCSSLDLWADTTRAPLFYYNPWEGTRVKPYNPLNINWTTDNEAASNPPSRLITRITRPPWEDTWYILQVIDSYGLERYDSVFYNSIQSKANIKMQYITLSDSAEYPGKEWREEYYDEGSLTAPGRFSFDVSGSRNMASYEVKFGDGEMVTLGSDSLYVVHEYKKPGKYTAVLTTISALPDECPDSMSVELELLFATAENFEMPNVFSPNGDGSNDVFRCKEVSVAYVDISIFTRAGLKVHSYKGYMTDWEGWDGHIKDSGREAPDGVYFYVISVLHAFEDMTSRIGSKAMKGFVHLYRNGM
jgi:gliding motility-associated-like protein